MKSILRISLLLVFGLTLVANQATAQTKEEKRTLKKARKHLTLGQYEEAKEKYDKLVEMSPNQSEYWFEAGLAYYNSNLEREKSIAYFERARDFTSAKENGEILYTDTIGEVFYYLGRAYQFVGRFEDAIDEYNNFKDFVKTNAAGDVLARDVNGYIAMCNNGIEFTKTVNDDVVIENLGENINSTFPEYAQVVNKDETVIIFTGRRDDATGEKFYHDNKRYEDIYVSVKQGEEWIMASRIDSTNKYVSSKINSKYHDAAISYSHDEKKLFIYRKNDVWQSELVNGVWSEPVRLNNNINTRGHEPSVFISPDGKSLFVVSNRKEGVGGRDIFVSSMQADGTWGPVAPIEAINTSGDEDAPFLTADGKTLFYSSNGSGSMGGYDIFKVEKLEDGSWGKPENLGMPINTPGDDIYYTQNEDGTVAYYSSSKPFGYGDMDIYRVQLECRTIPNTEIRGILVSGDTYQPMGGRIIITDNESGEEVGTFNVNEETGEYLLVLPPDRNYHLKVEANSYLPHNEDFYVPRQCEFYQMYQEIYIKYLTDTSWSGFYPQKAIFSNAMFDVRNEVENMYQIPDLEAAVQQSQQNAVTNNANMVDIVSRVAHNDVLQAQGVEVLLLNEKNEIVATTTTTEDGYFRFQDVDGSKNYSIMLDEEDSKMSYYGDSPDNGSNSVRVLGNVYVDKIGGTPIDSMDVYLVDDNKKVVNFGTTDAAGYFVMDNLPDETAIARTEELNKANAFPYNIAPTHLDDIYSAYITTIDPNNTELAYTEVVDIIDIEMIQDLYPDSVKTPEMIAFENILFDFDKYFLRDESKEELDKIAEYMLNNPEVTLDIEGHTDWRGSDAYNMKLSKKRTYAAYNYLIKKGIDKDRLNPTWHGEARPTAANANPDGSDRPEGRQQNRRVEFKVKVNTTTAALTLNFN